MKQTPTSTDQAFCLSLQRLQTAAAAHCPRHRAPLAMPGLVCLDCQREDLTGTPVKPLHEILSIGEWR